MEAIERESINNGAICELVVVDVDVGKIAMGLDWAVPVVDGYCVLFLSKRKKIMFYVIEKARQELALKKSRTPGAKDIGPRKRKAGTEAERLVKEYRKIINQAASSQWSPYSERPDYSRMNAIAYRLKELGVELNAGKVYLKKSGDATCPYDNLNGVQLRRFKQGAFWIREFKCPRGHVWQRAQ